MQAEALSIEATLAWLKDKRYCCWISDGGALCAKGKPLIVQGRMQPQPKQLKLGQYLCPQHYRQEVMRGEYGRQYELVLLHEKRVVQKSIRIEPSFDRDNDDDDDDEYEYDEYETDDDTDEDDNIDHNDDGKDEPPAAMNIVG